MKREKVQPHTYIWQPLQPLRQTVIPVRDNGRIAPDVSDGAAVGMASKVANSRRVME
jgi:hypothetical protein